MKDAVLVPTEASGKDEERVAVARNPLTLIHAARYTLDQLRLYLSQADDWREPMKVPLAQSMALDDLWLVGQIIARLTVLVESCATADPVLFLDLADRSEELRELRDELARRQAWKGPRATGRMRREPR